MNQPLRLEPATAGLRIGARSRLDAIDLLRGMVMVLMALDHVRDFFTAARFDPLDLTKTSVPLFLTRWITHFCAPVFVFLAGTGAFLAGTRGQTKAQLALFLWTRGLWLVALEFTLVYLGWSFNASYDLLVAQVIWAIGCSMVLLAVLVFLPPWVVGAVGVLLIAGHNALDGLAPVRPGSWDWVWARWWFPGLVEPWPGVRLIVAYPVLPWFGIMALGYGLGAVWLLEPGRRRRSLIGLGLVLTLLFVGLRYANGYGDPRPWSVQATDLFTLFSFLHCSKYPPSLLYTLMTLGPALVALGLFDRPLPAASRPLVVFGRVPLFFYLLHVPLIHLLAIGLALAQLGDAGFLFRHMLFQRPPPEFGLELPGVYLVWIVVVLLLYPPCRWFAALKQRSRCRWLSYF